VRRCRGPPTLRLDGRRALVTGAGRGIDQAAAVRSPTLARTWAFFLGSDASAHVTGTLLMIEGGWTAM
jgi:hypothetical protein